MIFRLKSLFETVFSKINFSARLSSVRAGLVSFPVSTTLLKILIMLCAILSIDHQNKSWYLDHQGKRIMGQYTLHSLQYSILIERGTFKANIWQGYRGPSGLGEFCQILREGVTQSIF